MASQVIVFDYGEPRFRLLAWFLSDSGIDNYRVTALADAVALLGEPRRAVIIINSTAPSREISKVAAGLKAQEPQPRIIVMHAGHHTEDELQVLADLCVHGVGDVDDLVNIVRATLENEVPDGEPHQAARDLTED
jgi:DNA-binding response OmpR family regulator